MKIALIFPPFSTFSDSPPAALTSLSAYLKEHEVEVISRDLNIAFMQYFLDHWENLKNILIDDLERRLVGERKTKLPYERLQLLLRVSIPLVCRLQIKKATRLLKHNIRDIANTYFLDNLFLESEYLCVSLPVISSQIDQKITDPVLTNFLGSYRWDHMDFISFSLLSDMQFPYAILMARALRNAYPHLRFVAGGPYITEIFPNLLISKEIFKDFDYLVVHEGESALLDILAQGMDSHHPNVFSLQRIDNVHGPFHVENLRSLPVQDFKGIDLEFYQPFATLNVYSSKGCSWCKCAFCSINHIIRYRERNILPFVEGMIQTMHETGISSFQIVDEDIPPIRLKELAEKIIECSPSPLRWSIQTRFYPHLDRELLMLLQEAGCYNIEFGLESASMKTLKKIKKGISLKTARRIIADCYEVGMGVILNCMVGFPGEEETDAEETVTFLNEILAQYPNIDIMCNTQLVRIYKNSDFCKNPTRYGIKTFVPYELSPFVEWIGPKWIPQFMNKYREHLLFAHRSSRSFKDYTIELIGDDPWVSLSEYSIFLEKSKALTSYTTISGNSSYLIRMLMETYQVFRLNETMEMLVQLLAEEKRRLSTLKEDFINRYQGNPHALEVLGKGLILLNEKGAIAFNEY